MKVCIRDSETLATARCLMSYWRLAASLVSFVVLRLEGSQQLTRNGSVTNLWLAVAASWNDGTF